MSNDVRRVTMSIILLAAGQLASCEPTESPTGLKPDFNGQSQNAKGPPIRPSQTKDWCDRNPDECAGSNPDPDPSATGYYLGSEITYGNCTQGASGPGGDVDADGFSDYCEELIATFFRPELVFSAYEQFSGHEPYWAVRQTYQGAVIFFALPYYRDGGAYGPLCSGCTAHLGDSEVVVFTVLYNSASKHWYLEYGSLSAHGNWNDHSANAFEFPDKQLGYPRVYVAEDKHANYATEALCDSGAYTYDFCAPTTYTRYRVYSTRNLGNFHVKRINCIQSQENPALAGGHSECFFSDDIFTGWSGAVEPTPAPGYRYNLALYGFQ